MDDGCEGVGPGARNWISPVGDLKGGLGDAAGAEEGIPVGVGRRFIKIVIGLIAEGNAGEPPSASGPIGIELAAAEGDATEFRTGDDTAGTKIERCGLT